MKFVCDVCNERCTVTEGKAPQVCLATGGNEAKWREIPDVYITVNDNWDIILDRRKIGTLEWNPTFLMDEDNDIVLTYVRDDDYDAEVPVHRCKWKLGSDKCTTCGKGAEMAIAEDSKFRNIRPGGR